MASALPVLAVWERKRRPTYQFSCFCCIRGCLLARRIASPRALEFFAEGAKDTNRSRCSLHVCLLYFIEDLYFVTRMFFVCVRFSYDHVVCFELFHREQSMACLVSRMCLT